MDGEQVELLVSDLVRETSSSSLVYGNGRQIHYDVARIAERLRENLIIGITEIDFSGEITFDFRGVIEESNPYN